jgi:hypothetical protein
MKKLSLVLVILLVACTAFSLDIRIGKHSSSNAYEVSVGQWFYLGQSDMHYSHNGIVFRFAPDATMARIRVFRSSYLQAVSVSLCAQMSYWFASLGIGIGPVVGVSLQDLKSDNAHWCFPFGGRMSLQVTLGKRMALIADVEVLYDKRLDAAIHMGLSAAIGR